ncbi:MAG: hypothetical protein GF418_01105 [Chitinivibrionales bacterium]|nr:hypothetical protein [Chitinivibrionales bacterium]MBD3394200.1 hypothetical protein [Chitinivibrionales bacterium]
MPGLYGIAAQSDVTDTTRAFTRMRSFIETRDGTARERTLEGGLVCAGVSQPGFVPAHCLGAQQDGVFLWLDGEIYNPEELKSTLRGTAAQTDPELLLALFLAHPGTDWLRRIDGFFAAAICDTKRRRLTLITDRYGLRHVRWTQQAGWFAWASETKAFLDLPGFSPKVSAQAVDDFLRYNYLTAGQTLLEGVRVLPPASLLTLDLRTGKTESRTYWTWDSITGSSRAMGGRDIAEHWGELFVDAVRRRCGTEERVGVTLSGGLDSRAILAAASSLRTPVPAVTFGRKGCADIRIASRVARAAGADHHVFETPSGHWLGAALEGVWATDGELCLADACGNEFLKDLGGMCDACMNGIGGDGIHGGSYLGMRGQPRDPSGDPYGYRGRRYIRQGFRYDESFMRVRMPFYDNALVEFMLTIPDAQRTHSRTYNRILLHNYPAYFSRIPWQKTGVPVSVPWPWSRMFSLSAGAYRRARRMLAAAGVPYDEPRRTIDCSSLMRAGPFQGFFERLLFGTDVLYGDLTGNTAAKNCWDRLVAGQDAGPEVAKYATLEIWLQQAFNKKFLPGFGPNEA